MRCGVRFPGQVTPTVFNPESDHARAGTKGNVCNLPRGHEGAHRCCWKFGWSTP